MAIPKFWNWQQQDWPQFSYERNASRATATRDLQDLVDKMGLCQTGALKGTRYYLRLDQRL